MAKKIIVTIEDADNVYYGLNEVANQILNGNCCGTIGVSSDEWEVTDTDKPVKVDKDELKETIINFIKTQIDDYGQANENGDHLLILNPEAGSQLFHSGYDGAYYFTTVTQYPQTPTDIEELPIATLSGIIVLIDVLNL